MGYATCPYALVELLISEFDVWTFKQDTNGSWIWLRYSPDGEPLAASRADYERFDDCVADAQRRGYKGERPKRC
jgi:hypothetical protein